MARLCERPGCSQPAEVAYGIEPQHLSVWVGVLDVSVEERPGVLCRHHADSLTVPLGWSLDDRREPIPRLFRAPRPVVAPARDRASRPPSPTPVGVQLELRDAVPASIVGRRHRPAPEAAAAVEETSWRPLFDLDDDLDGLLVARGPLLSRAFHARPRLGTT
jgi:hypothetical protein